MSEILKQHIQSIINISEENFDLLQGYFHRKHFRKHQLLVQEGNMAQFYYFIESGLTKSYHVDEKGKEHIVGFAMDEYWVTDIEAFFNQTPALINIQCLESTVVVAISFAEIEKLCSLIPEMQYFFRRKLTAENILLQKRILCLIKNNATAKYHDLLNNHPALVRRLPKTLIAAFLGVSRETLSRLAVKV